MIYLQKAVRFDCLTIHDIQVRSFSALLDKYGDYDTNPAAEDVERIYQRFDQSSRDYYLICTDEQTVGMLGVCDFGRFCRLSPICILPEHQRHGYAQRAMELVEDLYPNAWMWTLDTILQEDRLCYLYEKMGYRRSGKSGKIKEGMDLVFYEKLLR